jgi:hypothetical protein
MEPAELHHTTMITGNALQPVRGQSELPGSRSKPTMMPH